jgi:hypothetical protein
MRSLATRWRRRSRPPTGSRCIAPSPRRPRRGSPATLPSTSVRSLGIGSSWRRTGRRQPPARGRSAPPTRRYDAWPTRRVSGCTGPHWHSIRPRCPRSSAASCWSRSAGRPTSPATSTLAWMRQSRRRTPRAGPGVPNSWARPRSSSRQLPTPASTPSPNSCASRRSPASATAPPRRCGLGCSPSAATWRSTTASRTASSR